MARHVRPPSVRMSALANQRFVLNQICRVGSLWTCLHECLPVHLVITATGSMVLLPRGSNPSSFFFFYKSNPYFAAFPQNARCTQPSWCALPFIVYIYANMQKRIKSRQKPQLEGMKLTVVKHFNTESVELRHFGPLCCNSERCKLSIVLHLSTNYCRPHQYQLSFNLDLNYRKCSICGTEYFVGK